MKTLAIITALVLTNCMSTTHPDGTITRQLDPDALRVLAPILIPAPIQTPSYDK